MGLSMLLIMVLVFTLRLSGPLFSPLASMSSHLEVLESQAWRDRSLRCEQCVPRARAVWWSGVQDTYLSPFFPSPPLSFFTCTFCVVDRG